jgi:serine/threonine protein kinase
MADVRTRYRLDARPIARSAQTEVLRATSRSDGSTVVVKRRLDRTAPTRDRMRREIKVQSSISHANVMPILDFDADGYEWFVMPLAEGTLEREALPMGTGDLASALREAAAGLLVAHEAGFVHRDVKPSNILRLDDHGGRRWVVADWGIVRRPRGGTTANHTQAGTFMGTVGFAPPEAYNDAHSATFAWDAYSLGRIAAWASTGTSPTPLVGLAAPEPWSRFVRILTDPDPAKRAADMGRVLELIELAITDLPSAAGVDEATRDAALRGDLDAGSAVLQAALDHPDEGDFFIDVVAEVTGEALQHLVRTDRAAASELLALMDKHLRDVPWGRRDFDHYNEPLHWIQSLAAAAAEHGAFDLLDDACAVLFVQEPPLDRYRQKDRSRRWLASLEGVPAARAARLLREHPKAAAYYSSLPEARDSRIRAVLSDQPGSASRRRR